MEHINQLKAAEAFSRQSSVFDAIYGEDPIIQYKRDRVRSRILKHVSPGAHLLELNCGTGEDALFFAKKGFTVHATDISEAMLRQLQQKNGGQGVSTECCSFLELQGLRKRGPYDHVYSNFGGLNCTADLSKVVQSLEPLVKKGGSVTLVLISSFCFWEIMMALRGKFRTAFRRFFSSNGRVAHVEGRAFKCWYYSPALVRKSLHNAFSVVAVEGLCTIVPPSYIQGFANKYPKTFAYLKKMEEKYKSRWPWTSSGDYFIITLRKN